MTTVACTEYCFAVLGDRHQKWKAEQRNSKPKQQSPLQYLLNFIAGYQNRDTLEARLMKMGYPILISNRTDPFGRKNRPAAFPVIELLTDLGFKLAFQTKGFVKEDDCDRLLDTIGPSCFYISIAFDSTIARELIEPGAPTIQHRLNLIEKLTNAGHSVSVGLNPYIPEFLPDPRPLLNEIKKRGAYGCWVEMLHLNTDQVRQMSDRDKDALGHDVIAKAKKRKPTQQHWDEFFRVRDLVQESGLELYSMGQGNRSDFWEPYQERYKSFPVLQDFVNWCHENKSDGDRVYCKEFEDLMLPELPDGIHQVGHYIGCTARQICRENKPWSNNFTYQQLLRWMWLDARIPGSPGRTHGFAYARRLQQYIFDDDGLPILIWHPNGTMNYYCEV